MTDHNFLNWVTQFRRHSDVVRKYRCKYRCEISTNITKSNWLHNDEPRLLMRCKVPNGIKSSSTALFHSKPFNEAAENSQNSRSSRTVYSGMPKTKADMCRLQCRTKQMVKPNTTGNVRQICKCGPNMSGPSTVPGPSNVSGSSTTYLSVPSVSNVPNVSAVPSRSSFNAPLCPPCAPACPPCAPPPPPCPPCPPACSEFQHTTTECYPTNNGGQPCRWDNSTCYSEGNDQSGNVIRQWNTSCHFASRVPPSGLGPGPGHSIGPNRTAGSGHVQTHGPGHGHGPGPGPGPGHIHGSGPNYGSGQNLGPPGPSHVSGPGPCSIPGPVSIPGPGPVPIPGPGAVTIPGPGAVPIPGSGPVPIPGSGPVPITMPISMSNYVPVAGTYNEQQGRFHKCKKTRVIEHPNIESGNESATREVVNPLTVAPIRPEDKITRRKLDKKAEKFIKPVVSSEQMHSSSQTTDSNVLVQPWINADTSLYSNRSSQLRWREGQKKAQRINLDENTCQNINNWRMDFKQRKSSATRIQRNQDNQSYSQNNW